MFQFAVFAHHRGLAVALRLIGPDSQRSHAFLTQKCPQFLADVHQVGQIIDIAPGEGVFDHSGRDGLTGGGRDGAAGFLVRFLDPDAQFANPCLHLRPSSPLICEASSPPAREWMRGPVVIARITTISSARGASFRPTSIESKWLRT